MKMIKKERDVTERKKRQKEDEDEEKR